MAGGWTWFTEQRRNIHHDDHADPYPQLAPGNSSNSKTNELRYAKALAKGLNSQQVDNGAPLPHLPPATLQGHEPLLQDAGGRELPSSSGVNEESALESDDENAAQQKESASNDDVYLRLRKESIKVSRLMSKHARAATNAYQRGDHFRAKQLSRELQQEKQRVEKLNAEAAEEILNLRNGNDPWRIDLHGLHAREAVAVLERKLVELEASIVGASSSSRYSEESRQFSQPASASCTDHTSCNHEGPCRGELRSGLKAPSRRELTVITGAGVHSRDGPSLPNAVISFLLTNDYMFIEPHRGAIVVQLKLRRTPVSFRLL